MTPCWLPDTVTTDLDRMVSRALLWGIEALELRLVGGPTRRVPHVNEPPLRRRLDEAELDVAAVVPGHFEGPASDRAAALDDLSRLDDTLQFCGRFRCRRIVISSFQSDGPLPPEALDILRRAGDRAARHGIALAVLNESGMSAETGESLAQLIEAVGHPAVRAALDAGMVSASASACSALAGKLELVRFGAVSGGPSAVDVVRALAQTDFDGPVSLVLGVGTTGKEGLHEAGELIGAIRRAVRVQNSKPT